MTTTEAPSVIGEATVGELQAAVRGSVIRPGDSNYDEARAVWNAAHDKHPALIIRCTGTADVIKAVEFARSQGLPLAVRGGAHSIAGFSTCDDGVVLDLSPMKAVTVDPHRRRAVAQGGATWADFDHETQAFGLAVTGGLVSTTGLGGFTLGGGIGWLLRRHGLTCDSLVGADVVLADGRLVHASDEENSDLLWGLRGGGGNFGVATALEYALQPVGPTVLGGLVFFPGEAARDVLIRWRELTASMPDELTSLVVLTTAPPVPFLPESVHGAPIVAIGAMYCGPLGSGEEVVRPLRTLADPIADLMGPVPTSRCSRCSTRCGRPARTTTSPPRWWTAFPTAQSMSSSPDGRPSPRHRARSTSTTPAAPWPRASGEDGVRAAQLAVHPQHHRPVRRRCRLRRRCDLGPRRPCSARLLGPAAMYVNFTGEAGRTRSARRTRRRPTRGSSTSSRATTRRTRSG